MPESLSELGWGWLPATSGLFLTVVFLLYARSIVVRRRSWVRTEATVGKVRFRPPSSSGGSSGTSFNYHFTDATGQQRMGAQDRWFRKPRRGSRVQVRYDPENPGSSEEVLPLWCELALVGGGLAAGVSLVLLSLGGAFS